MATEFKWYGNKVFTETRKVAKSKEKEIAKKIFDDAVKGCPVGKWERSVTGGKSWTARRPGALRDTIEMYKSKFKDGGYIVMAGSYDVFYARFVELGTPGTVKVYRGKGRKKTVQRTPIPKNPFLRRAAKKNEPTFYQALRWALGAR